MPNFSPLELSHAFSTLAALIAGYYALAYDGVIGPTNWLGKSYIWATQANCITGAGLLAADANGVVHALGLAALLLLALAAWAGARARQQFRWQYVATLSYTLTLFLQMVVGLTKMHSKGPQAISIGFGWTAPGLEAILGIVSLVFVAVGVLQVRFLLLERQNRNRSIP